MSKIDEVTLGDVRRSLVRYQPFIAVVVAIAALMVVLPGKQSGTGVAAGDSDSSTPYAESLGGDTAVDAGAGAAGGTGAGGATTGAGGTAGAGSKGTTSGGATTGGAGRSGPVTGAGTEQGMVDNCDPATGRIAIPTRFAPICVPKFSGDNGGSTYRGVTADTIKMVYFKVAEDAATDAVLTAASANDTNEQEAEQVKQWIDFYQAHFQMYGRKVEFEYVTASGPATDAAAGRADAIKVADEIGAFGVWNASNNTMVDEVVARGVMCFCTVSQPIENYQRWAPYVWTTLLASTQGYIHRAEYIGKRLKGGKAQWAGDALFQQQERTFGIMYYDTDDKSYKPGVDFFVQHLKDEYGVTPKVVAEYHGYPETARSQEEARPLIQKFVQAGVSSIICVCDPFGPIFFTQEATRQAYQPEWIVTGSALTDTSFFARLYDQLQWAHAFGISYLPARLPEELQDSFRLLKWQYDPDNPEYEPAAPAGYGVIRGPMDLFFHGVHLAGPNLTPESFKTGMFAAPPAGENSITGVQVSFGEKGIWDWPDYIAFDDVTEIWWDPAAEGEDEIGANGRGLYRYVDMGKRYLPGQHPASPPKAFDPANTATIYDKPPPNDQWPEYPPPGKQ
ncbi:MAG TPA: hypothetical protein VFU93_09500 [Acidimicrobiales bacterium]|nr:hypothetical protein [Acidimicrobiales bacterium]